MGGEVFSFLDDARTESETLEQINRSPPDEVVLLDRQAKTALVIHVDGDRDVAARAVRAVFEAMAKVRASFDYDNNTGAPVEPAKMVANVDRALKQFVVAHNAANSGMNRMQREFVMMQDSGEILSYAADGTAVPGTPQFTPKDYTEIFTKQLRETYDHFRKLYWKAGETFGPRSDHWLEHLVVFQQAVTDNAPADLKRRMDLPYNETAMGGPYALFRGERWTPADFGNFNFGVAAYAYRIPLMMGTGAANLNQLFKSGNFDSDRSLEMIMGGYDYAMDRGFDPWQTNGVRPLFVDW